MRFVGDRTALTDVSSRNVSFRYRSPMDRRAFTALCAGAPLLAAAAAAHAISPVPSNEAFTALPPDLLQDPAAARLIGDRLRNRLSGPIEREQLLASTGLDGAWSASHMREALAETREGDFAAGRTVEIDGWILARCEAALCLLLSIDRGVE